MRVLAQRRTADFGGPPGGCLVHVINRGYFQTENDQTMQKGQRNYKFSAQKTARVGFIR